MKLAMLIILPIVYTVGIYLNLSPDFKLTVGFLWFAVLGNVVISLLSDRMENIEYRMNRLEGGEDYDDAEGLN